MWDLIKDAITTPGLSALLGVLIGGVITAVTSYLLERQREKSRKKLDLLKVRREVELEALEAAHNMVRQFAEFPNHNHDGHDEEADRAQAATIEVLGLRAEELSIIALRVDVLASHRVAQLIQEIPDRIFNYFADITNDEKIYADKANIAISDLLQIIDALKKEVRRDLQTSLLDDNKRFQRSKL